MMAETEPKGLTHGEDAPCPAQFGASSPGRRAHPSRSRRSSSPTPARARPSSQIQACGVCHTDLHYREGGINDDFPFLLGHEAAGRRRGGREGVTDVAPGDFVILNWRAVCGNCRACLRGRPWYCFNTHNATQKMTLDGRHRAVAGARHRRVRGEDPRRGRSVHEGRPGRARRGRRPARLRSDGRARRGHQHRQRQRGDSVAVFGCGGVGDAAIAGAPLAGARPIIAVDIDDRKLELGQGVRRHPHGQLAARPIRSRRSRR